MPFDRIIQIVAVFLINEYNVPLNAPLLLYIYIIQCPCL